MFERYTEKARRVIFFARYEASQFGSPYIETEHLLLGVLREDKALTNRFLRTHASVESIRKKIEGHAPVREKVPTSVDLPLSDESKRVLAYAAEEAERLANKNIAPEHLFLGLLREERCYAATLLNERGLNLAAAREQIAKMTAEPASKEPTRAAPQQGLVKDLTQCAIDGQFEPVIGREAEIECVLEVLAGSRRRNVMLLGERGVGKTAIVEALAQRIADGVAPPFLADKRIVAIEPESLAGWKKGSESDKEPKTTMFRGRFEIWLNQVVQSLLEAPDFILVIDSLQDLVSLASSTGSHAAARILKLPLIEGELQCVATATPAEYQVMIQGSPWLEVCFRALHLRALDEQHLPQVLETRKGRIENRHEVTFTAEALALAARSSGRCLPEQPLPGKALDLLDAAAARFRLRQGEVPEEVQEVQKRIRFIVHRMDAAIRNHELEKARFYSDEEKKERDNLRGLHERYRLKEAPSSVIGPAEIEEVIALWSKYPYCP